MKNYAPLTQEQFNILLKCYYLRKYTKVAKTEKITTDKVKRIKENALRSVRLAYSKSYMQGLRFDGKTVLQHMAARCGMAENDLSKIFDKYIAEGLASEYKRYWERIRKAGDTPTAAELLDFIYDKFEVDIEGGI
ncbi:hypothetical protein RWV98_06935 [Agathobaculum sp. NTUH-O15-33]|uniref:hypothetical protein n=1 Tax=Agathobaculum sp. NTUH-O15-33 TaxID=3079302 RepID=UPI002958629E|nr:hypothetical protein [Agathobaculum sp. NTUH-O15-33]WNX85999.1 hypothetical protein RWV98_06935 [Agathobaculum sp. NTUH-O15-33]